MHLRKSNKILDIFLQRWLYDDNFAFIVNENPLICTTVTGQAKNIAVSVSLAYFVCMNIIQKQ